LYIHAAASSAITAVRTALVDIFFTAEAGDTIAAIASEDFDFRFVNKFHELIPEEPEPGGESGGLE